jgi:hypothetical protein
MLYDVKLIIGATRMKFEEIIVMLKDGWTVTNSQEELIKLFNPEWYSEIKNGFFYTKDENNGIVPRFFSTKDVFDDTWEAVEWEGK